MVIALSEVLTVEHFYNSGSRQEVFCEKGLLKNFVNSLIGKKPNETFLKIFEQYISVEGLRIFGSRSSSHGC